MVLNLIYIRCAFVLFFCLRCYLFISAEKLYISNLCIKTITPVTHSFIFLAFVSPNLSFSTVSLLFLSIIFFLKYVNNDFQCTHLSGSHFGRGVSHYGTPGGTHHQWYLKCQCSCEITLMHLFTLSNFCRSSFSYDIKTSQDHLTWPFILNSSSYCYCYYFLRQ